MVATTSVRVEDEVLSSRRQIAVALEAAHEEAVEYWGQYDTAAFFTPMGGTGRRRRTCAT